VNARPIAVLGACAALSCPAVTAAEEATPRVQVRVSGGARSVTATLSGRLAGYALPRVGSGKMAYLLVAPGADPAGKQEEDPCEKGVAGLEAPAGAQPFRLFRLDVAGAGDLRELTGDLPADTGGLEAFDADGDGREDLIVEHPGHLGFIRLDDTGEIVAPLTPWIDDAEVDAGGLDPRSISAIASEAMPWAVPVLGGVRFYDPSRDARPGTDAVAMDLPIKVTRERGGLRLSTPSIRVVGPGPAGRILFAVGPERVESRRLRTLLLDPAAPGSARVIEVWSRLPGPEVVIESFYTILDGRPALIVTTRSARKLSFLEEKTLRVFFLDGPDRSRAGSTPVFAVESNANLWQQALPVVTDVDRDGREDLVFAYYRGIKDDRVVLDVYIRGEDGAFARSPRSTQFELDDADRSMIGYGADLTGDGIADLILEAGGRTLVYAGSPEPRGGRHLVEEKPRWSFEAEGSWQARVISVTLGKEEPIFSGEDPIGRPRIADFDGDGRGEILSIGRTEEGGSRFGVTFLGNAPDE